MKKILALTLAAVMAMGSATVAFATPAPKKVIQPPLFSDSEATNILFKKNTDGFLVSAVGEFKAGTTLYIPLAYEIELTKVPASANKKTTDVDAVNAAGNTAVEHSKIIHAPMTESEMNKYKVKAEMTVGQKLITKSDIEYVKFVGGGSDPDFYAYAVALYTDEAYTEKTADIAGKITVYRSSAKSPTMPLNTKDADTESTPIYDSVALATFIGQTGFNYDYYGFDAVPISDNGYIIASNGASPVRKFTGEEDVSIEFEGVGTFDVDASNQSALNLTFSTKFNEEIGAQFNEDLEFITFKANPMFNKTGIMRLYTANKDAVVYKVDGDNLVEIESTYDDEYEAVKFATRSFGTYIIAEKQLSDTSILPVPGTDTAKPIPDTGR